MVLGEDLVAVDEAGTRREQWLRPLRPLSRVGPRQWPGTGGRRCRDGAVRRAYLALDLMVQPSVPSFGLAIAEARRAALGRPVVDPVRDFGLPAGLATPLVVNYLGPPRTIRTVSLYQALEPST